MLRDRIIAAIEEAVFTRRRLVLVLFAMFTLVMGYYATKLRIDAGGRLRDHVDVLVSDAR